MLTNLVERFFFLFSKLLLHQNVFTKLVLIIRSHNSNHAIVDTISFIHRNKKKTTGKSFTKFTIDAPHHVQIKIHYGVKCREKATYSHRELAEIKTHFKSCINKRFVCVNLLLNVHVPRVITLA